MNQARLLKGFLYFILISFLFLSCKKNGQDPVSNPNPSSDGDLGSIFSSINSSISELGSFNLNREAFQWRAPANIWDNNGMIYENGIIYTGNVYGVSAVDSKSGTMVWTKKFLSISYSQSSTKPYNQPVIRDSFLYMIGFYSGESAGLYCLNKNTGILIWQKNLTEGISAEWEYSTPVIMGDKIIAVTHGSNYEYNRIQCLNRITGSILWKKVINDGHLLNHPIELDPDHILFGTSTSELLKVNVADGSVSPFASTLPSGKLLSYMSFFLRNNELVVGTNFGIQIFDRISGSIKRILRDTIYNYAITPKAFYIQKPFGIVESHDFNSYAKNWSWVSPLRKFSDTVRGENVFLYGTSCLVSDDHIVYYYENYFHSTKRVFNSIFLLNAETGTLIKEIQLSTTWADPTILGLNQMVMRNGKVLQPLSNYIKWNWTP